MRIPSETKRIFLSLSNCFQGAHVPRGSDRVLLSSCLFAEPRLSLSPSPHPDGAEGGVRAFGHPQLSGASGSEGTTREAASEHHFVCRIPRRLLPGAGRALHAGAGPLRPDHTLLGPRCPLDAPGGAEGRFWPSACPLLWLTVVPPGSLPLSPQMSCSFL